MSQNLSDAAESLNDSLDASRCKYYHKSDLMVQCYYDDEHLLREIYAFIELTNLEWVITVIYALVFITGVVGNFLVGYAVWRNKYLRTITNFFLTNLAVADFLTIVFCLPPSFAQTILETWFLGNTMCKMVSYLQVSFCVNVQS
ncbi:orexin receptor type 2 [Biomphalaria glabrata]|nr:orexin receptor type 2 [Biomphalaria glabrata]